MRAPRKRYVRIIAAAIIVAALCVILFISGFLSTHQLRLADSLYGGKPILSDIVIIGIDDRSLQDIGRWPWGRENFTMLVERVGSAQVIGLDVALFERSTPQADDSLSRLNDFPVVTVSEYTGFRFSGKVMIGEELLMPISPLNVSTGFANILSDSDGVTRALNLDIGDEPAFSAALYSRVTGKDYPKTSRFMIDFAQPGAFKTYSASDVLSGKISRDAFEGKIVMIGATAEDFHDNAIVPTSSGEPMTGVEIHANALNTMLLGTSPSTASPWLTVIMILLSVSIVAALMLRFSPLTASLALLGIVALYIVLTIRLFEQGVVLNIVYIPLSVAISFVVLLAIRFMDERAAKRKVSEAFGKYMSPHLLERVMREGAVLGGERRELTVMFCDIRGFTGTSEKLSPEDLVDVLNSHFNMATEIIHEQQGLVDKFIGDAVMAFWNAPIADKRHAENAAISAILMRDAAKVPIGIGLNTGVAVVGNIGSHRHLSYTAIGDSVNLASRLEGLTKEYGVRIIIGESTKRLLSSRFVVRELDRVRVKGKKEPVRIYELVADKPIKDKPVKERFVDYERALKLYYRGDWARARKAFERIGDPPSKTMMLRCEEFVVSAPKDWAGVYEMKKK